MVTVILDSSTTSLSVGIAKEGKLIKGISYEAWQKQSELMIPELDKLMSECNVKKEDISNVIVGIGPGSYTGVRIAVSIAKVMSVALNIPLYVVSSLQILKDGDKESICLIDARSKRSYFGVYKGNEVIIKDQILTNDEVRKYISEHPSYTICGDTQYLGLEDKKTDIFSQMLSLLTKANCVDNPLSVKPVYLKD